MIGGYPHRYEDSCFHLAVEQLRKKDGADLIPSIYTMGGFPVTRALKHLPARCLGAKPDIVVVQFGPSDLVVPLRRNHHRHQDAAVKRKVSLESAGVKDRLRWVVQGMVGDLLRLGPVTPLEVYLETMRQIVQTVAGQPAITVILSPFIFGGHRSDRLARVAISHLRQIVSAVPGARLVDAYAALDQHPRRRMLLKDGTHLSLAGQVVAGDCLYATLADILKAGKATPTS